jgi:hypothetical protein
MEAPFLLAVVGERVERGRDSKSFTPAEVVVGE